MAQAPGPADRHVGTLVLAGNKTRRPDFLSGFHKYRGGWDIANKHYWASVGYTGLAGVILALLWFISFGLALVVHYCCGWQFNIRGREWHFSQNICLVVLIVLTCSAAIGCVLLFVGQDDFHAEALDTLKYVVNQSDYTVQTINLRIKQMKTQERYEGRSALITIAAVMLLISILGLCLSILGHQHAIHIFIISGWLLVSVTFVLCGVFVIIN